MPIVFFTSSAGDTDLAKATIEELLQQNADEQLHVVPLTEVSASRLINLPKAVSQEPLTKLLGLETYPEQLDQAQLDYLKKQAFGAERYQRAYVGVPSPQNAQLPYQIAMNLDIPCVVVNEFMYEDKEHDFFKHVADLTAKGCEFAMPMPEAEKDVLAMAKNAKTHAIGHLSIDRAIQDPMIFVSGSTRPRAEDAEFLEALLKELAKGNHPNLQLRFGIHPGVVDMDGYLADLLQVCARHENLASQVKIVLNQTIKGKLKGPAPASHFLLEEDLSGADLAKNADGITQVVPGALLNEGHLNNKSTYCHTPVKSYLTGEPKQTITSFYEEVCKRKANYEKLGLEGPAPKALAKVLKR